MIRNAKHYIRPGYTLVIAEKPKAAAKIATALGLNRKGRINGIPFWHGYFNGEYYVVVPAAGHLFSLKPLGSGYPIFSYEWAPRWEVERESKFLKKFFHAISVFAEKASKYVNACDYDIEGSVIGYLIISKICSSSNALRAKFSSLTKEELVKAFKNLKPLDVEMIEAGLCRHELDWIWGINVSRALMDIFKTALKRHIILSAGRVQTPTLVEVINREVEREAFVPEIWFTVSVTIDIDGRKYKVENCFQAPQSKELAEKLASEIRGTGYLIVRNVARDLRSLRPPPPFNLPDLQVEAARSYGISPSETLRIAENLYLESLISYPRTNSQRLPPTLDNRRIINSLSRISRYNTYCKELLGRGELTPTQGSKADPAHPAIYPTGYLPKRKLTRKEELIYDLIVRRYLASFYNNALISTLRIELTLPKTNLSFSLTGQRIIRREWLKVYGFIKIRESELPKLEVGDVVRIDQVRVVKGYSKPPKLYTKSSLLRWMENVGIGTEATRADIIETLFKRGYLVSRGGGIRVTDLGIKVAMILQKVFKELTEVSLTREFEEKLSAVKSGKVRREEVVTEARKVLEPRLIRVKELVRLNGGEGLRELLGGSDSCSICGNASRYIVNNLRLCDLHFKAYKSVISKYRVWRERSGVNFTEYLKAIIKLPSTGRLSKEVAEYLLKDASKA